MKTGLLLVDIQNDYFPDGKMELFQMNAAGANASALLQFFRDSNWPTFHIQHISAYKGATFFLPDTDGADIHDGIKPLPGEIIIQKHFPNSFRETTLKDELALAGVEHLVVCGAMSHMCIDATTRAAADLGFTCTVVENACATRDIEFKGQKVAAQQVHGAFMAALGAAYAAVMSTDEFLTSVQPSG